MVHHNKNISENYTLKVNNIETESKKSVKLLAIEIDNKLLFDKHIAALSKKAANQLHTICILENQRCKMEKRMLICSLDWDFCSKKSMRKIFMGIILDNYESNYDALLHKSGKSAMEVKRLHTLAIEIFKTLNNQNLRFMRKIFY